MSLATGKRVVSSLSMSDQVVLGSSQNFSLQNIFETVRYIPDILRDGLVTELTVKQFYLKTILNFSLKSFKYGCPRFTV